MPNSEKLRFDLVLTRWEDGRFKSLDRIEATSLESLEEQLLVLIDSLHSNPDKLSTSHEITDDDDIPF